jgi:DNA modification methylase
LERQVTLYIGDTREGLRQFAKGSAQTCVTSPPYWGLRDYGHAGQIGLEPTPDAYVATMVDVFRCVRDVLVDDGTVFLNLGDSYFSGAQRADPYGASLKPKDLVGIPWRVAFALQADGWYLRQDIIWHKPNPMPEGHVRDRCTKAHEYLFLLTKSAKYYFDADAIAEAAAGGRIAFYGHASKGADASRQDGNRRDESVATDRNRRSVWSITSEPCADAHFAVMPTALVEPCIAAGSRPGDTVLDPFMGSGTVAKVAQDLGRKWIGCELNPEYAKIIAKRTAQAGLELCA